MWDLRYDEPKFEDMLCDPVMRAVMARDGVSREELVAQVERARRRLARPRDTAPQSANN